MNIGIEAMNIYGGPTFIDIQNLFKERNLDLKRFDNLMMQRKTVPLPCEDPVTYAVNAAKPIIDRLTQEEKDSIELVITSTESGLDFGKSLSTYIHEYLGLDRNNCRLFELKQACYGGTAAFHMASCFIASKVSPGARALVIATDICRSAIKNTYAEPSQGAGAVAMLVSQVPEILELDFGATGQYSFDVMDTFRPLPEIETGDPDLSLFAYLDCLEHSFDNYQKKVADVDFMKSFDFLAFHTPFAGLVKGAHRKMMRKFYNLKTPEIDKDFCTRVEPTLKYCVQMGNAYSATLYLALCGLIDSAPIDGYKRVGCFSYGSGCSSEFYSAVISPTSQKKIRSMKIQEHLDSRYELSMSEYDRILDLNTQWMFGIKDKKVNFDDFAPQYKHCFEGKNLLILTGVDDYHRKYGWS